MQLKMFNKNQEKPLTEQEATDLVQEYMKNERTITSTQEIIDSGEIPELKGFKVKPGKVSDSIFGGKGTIKTKSGQEETFENKLLETKNYEPIRLMVRTARISTHDITRGEIPFKDQILAINHNFMRKKSIPFIGSSQYDINGLKPSSVVIAAENLKSIMVENVLRAYMAKSSTSTSLYQAFINGKRNFCGHKLPENLIVNGQLPYIMDTPSTKSDEHDKSVSPKYLFENNICAPEQYKQIKKGALALFSAVTYHLKEKGLIAVDTKTEHGINLKGEIVGQDEIWTMDSSRFWKTDDYKKQLKLFKQGDEEGLVNYLKETQPGIKEKDYVVNGKVIIYPASYSKEFARGFSKGDKGYDDETRSKIAVRYIMGIQNLTGQRFEPDMRPRDERVISGLQTIVKELIR
ncbi:phosphoribosylaminoimidazolesuccinocarboxamide synthase [Candidatus Woesearchaeota archaeon]|nr:phosphoribosylaminoimidazolesuccinocarboxamide synthase [Candidatus Woesearchaeota archaeon]MCF7900612.1 phosphoribosylaminoimidazolesuccinocarboxamide synthase [Candidatus Woesearchaeota archaeon]MCF8013898.1 phosphoribosylaminoimidazolesuccinocarboxamide synthase [Candidatus Woesearchaeota archaeon]